MLFKGRWQSANLIWGSLSQNPSVGTDCSGITVGQEYCVERNFGIPVPSSTTTGGSTGPTGTVPSPVQDGIIDTCTSYYKAASGDDCTKIVAKFGTFTLDDFLKWNPAVGETCGGLWLGYYYCVATPEKPTATKTSAGSGPTGSVPSPVQDGITAQCKTYYKAVSGDDCTKIVAKYGTFTFADFLKWNPAVGETCSSLLLGYYYCVGVTGTPTQKPSTTATTSVPTQTGIVKNCQRWYKAATGDTCAGIVSKFGTFTLDQFLKWNPAVGSGCTSLYPGYNYCIGALILSPFLSYMTRLANYWVSGVPGTPTQPPKPSTTGCASAPNPTQPGAVCACKKWHKVASGNTCDTIQKQYGITAAQFNKWNPQVGATCTTLWLGYYVCVSA